MTKLQRLKRVIELKRQAIPLIRSEIHEAEERFCLMRMLTRLEKEIGVDFDPVLSQKIDALRVLLEER